MEISVEGWSNGERKRRGQRWDDWKNHHWRVQKCLLASRVSRECQWRLPAVSILGYSSGLLQFSFRYSCHPGLFKGCWCWKPRGNSCCCNNYLVITRNKLDSEAKKWRLVADVLNDIAMFMEILAPNFPTCFTLIVCSAGIFKSIVGVAGGATRAALTLHQARRDNMADISAKDGSQETLVNLAGLLVSLILIPLVTDNPLLTFVLFFLFTILHLCANYKAVRSVVMETLNEARLAIVLHQYLRDGRVLGPLEANLKEPVFLEFRRIVPIKLGVRLGEFIYTSEDLNLAMKNNHKPFLIGVKRGSVCVCLGPDASVCDEIRAVCQAVCLCTVLHPVSPLEGALKQLSMSHSNNHWELVHESHKLMDQIFQPFLKALEVAGWQTSRTLLDWNEWRVEWKKKSS
ncbi:RUS1 family protein C16orf58 homolog isoform X2 [Oncorhynchus mykiss]|uniref:RUS family member 1 n=1 Tax=Oncorhynchus mykiss TaxID=8022 RepID=A0A8K9UCP6_ONCMY|nr:RUS1 family protein C16orf58 homolog isoform X2 [Oncorhynchus mykiss]